MMLINVRLKLSIGLQDRQEDTHEIEVPDNWRELSDDERADILDEYWDAWAANYIDGYAKEE